MLPFSLFQKRVCNGNFGNDEKIKKILKGQSLSTVSFRSVSVVLPNNLGFYRGEILMEKQQQGPLQYNNE
tara:strand:+ start:536 stop:745 length:210 start_codon:yes stop_codon:yes gene_type:complete